MWSDFTDLSGDACGRGGEHLGEDLAAEDAVVADVEVLPFDHAGLDLGRGRGSATSASWSKAISRASSGAGRRRWGRRRWRPPRPRRPCGTWRSPASPRSCRHASWMKPKPWSRPADSWPPWVLSGQLAVAGDPVPALDERAALALAAEAERLEPGHGEEAEAVVELGDVDVGGLEVGALPEVGAGVAGGHRRGVVVLVPRRAAPQRRAHRLDARDRVVDVRRRARRRTRSRRWSRRPARRSRRGGTAW